MPASAGLTEFEIIARYFKTDAASAFVGLGIGDDCAVLQPSAGQQLLVSTDMLVEGRHFASDVPPEWLAHKALAVNASDLAACGATPKAFFLSLCLPQDCATDDWLAPFAQSLHSRAQKYGMVLAGGDTTRGDALTLSITVIGETPKPLLRSGAQAGDVVWVSGTLGCAALGLLVDQGEVDAFELTETHYAHVEQRLHTPKPRLKLGIALRGIASACMDVSDGLAGDARHLARASDVDAFINVDSLPRSAALDAAAAQGMDVLPLMLSGGDDYELLFTAPAHLAAAVQAAAQAAGVTVTPIGYVTAPVGAVPDVFYTREDDSPFEYSGKGYQHF